MLLRSLRYGVGVQRVERLDKQQLPSEAFGPLKRLDHLMHSVCGYESVRYKSRRFGWGHSPR